MAVMKFGSGNNTFRPGLGKGDVKIFVSPETLKVQKETLPMEEGLFLVSY